MRGNDINDPEDEELKDIMKIVRRELEIPKSVAMLGRTSLCRCDREIRRVIGEKTKYAFIFEADESLRKRMEGSLHKNHEDHITGQEMNPVSQNNFVHKFILVPSKENTICKKNSSG